MARPLTEFQLPYDKVIENGMLIEEVMARAWANYQYTMDWAAQAHIALYTDEATEPSSPYGGRRGIPGEKA